MHNNKTNNIIIKYIEDNNIDINLYKDCIYIHDTTLKELKKIFYNNIDITNIYNTNYICIFKDDLMSIFDGNIKIDARRNINMMANNDMFTSSYNINFEWKLQHKLLNQIHEDIYEHFLKQYAPNLTSFNNIGTKLTVANGGIAWVDYPNKINGEE